MTRKAWLKDGERRFGKNRLAWRFVCPVCGYEQSAQDYKACGAPDEAIGFSCVGRWQGCDRTAFGDEANNRKPGPCDYAGGGLFKLNPVEVDGHHVFAFAEGGGRDG